MFRSFFLTPYGVGSVSASELGVKSVEMPDLSRSYSVCLHGKLPEFEPSEVTINAAMMLQRYFNGECISFSNIPVDIINLTPFYQKVLNMIRHIKFGDICSYGQVAELCGYPRAARAVGGALAANPVPVIIPCHRVVASDGRLTGFSAPGGVISKKVMLQLEGIEFKGVLAVTNQQFMHRTSS